MIGWGLRRDRDSRAKTRVAFDTPCITRPPAAGSFPAACRKCARHNSVLEAWMECTRIASAVKPVQGCKREARALLGESQPMLLVMKRYSSLMFDVVSKDGQVSTARSSCPDPMWGSLSKQRADIALRQAVHLLCCVRSRATPRGLRGALLHRVGDQLCQLARRCGGRLLRLRANLSITSGWDESCHPQYH